MSLLLEVFKDIPSRSPFSKSVLQFKMTFSSSHLCNNLLQIILSNTFPTTEVRFSVEIFRSISFTLNFGIGIMIPSNYIFGGLLSKTQLNNSQGFANGFTC